MASGRSRHDWLNTTLRVRAIAHMHGNADRRSPHNQGCRNELGKSAKARYPTIQLGGLPMWFRTKIRQTGRGLSGAAPRLSASVPPLLICVLRLGFSSAPVFAQKPEVWNAPPSGDISIIPKPVDDTFDRVRMRNAPHDASLAQKNSENDDACLLPPLTLVHNPTVATSHLQVPAKARKEYAEACAALKDKKTENVEKHLRKAVQEYPQFSAAWVTLGQVLAARQQNEDARSACSQGSSADSNYVPAYLCLADIAAREKAWDEVLKLSGRALELDPAANAVAYEYNAAANLRVNKLADAEKSALRALEIDKNNTEPRVHFVLAQIYEAKGDSENEVAQLREYLKFASNPEDIAMVEQYLSQLEAGK
jgi:tetratricopeptide (TPR) repeat protein